MYPTSDMPNYGIFVKEQIDSLKKYFNIDYEVYFINGIVDKTSYIKSIFEIKRLVNKKSFDLIHVHYGLSGLFMLWLKRFRIPILVTLHGGDIQAEQGKKIQVMLTKLIIKKADGVITLNTKMDNIARNYVKRTNIIPCSVNTDLFYPSTIQIKKEKYLIVFPSDRSRYVKNYPLFDKTISILESRFHIECDVVEVKNMSRDQVRDLYQKADLLLMTSISEGSPQVVKEAMACNLKVVSTPVGDVKILLEGVKGSAVSENHDANELAELCMKSLNNSLFGIEGRDKIFKLMLDEKSVAKKVFELYNITLR